MFRIDTDGMPYWEQIQDTALFYGFNWNNRITALGGPDVTMLNAYVSTSSSALVPRSSRYESGIHVFLISPSIGNVGLNVVLTSKIFLSDGQSDKSRFRIKVLA